MSIPDAAHPLPTALRSCRVCGNSEGNAILYAREMMFGWGERFEYLECGQCGCLQIAAVPVDLARYYPHDGYYSYKAPRRKQYPAWLLRLREARTRHWLGERALPGALAALLARRPEHFDWFRGRGVTLDSRILDIGCGAGGLLLKLQREGFRSLLGADPFIACDIDYGNGVRVLKRGISSLEGRYDFVMLHHSFEHMDDPEANLRALGRLLDRNATLLLRMPVAGSHAHRRYGENWQAWEPPRHLYLQTPRSLALLAARTGLDLAEVVYDSSGQRLSSSELYVRGVPYVQHGQYRPGNRPDAFTRAEWKAFQREAEALNRAGQGDTACFYLRLTNGN